MTDAEFARAIRQAVEELPAPIRRRLEHTVFEIRDLPTREQARELGDDLLGLYTGTPMPERYEGQEPIFPDRITLFKKNIEAEAEDRDHMIEIIQDTVLHEVGHFLGLDDDELETMGL